MQSVNYLYAANGQKLRKQTRIDHQLAATYDYAGRFVYSDLNGDDTQLSYLMANQGRIILNEDGSFGYEYAIKDHLGNTRVTFDEKGKILQEDTYYPFGMNISGLSYNQNTIQNKYKYNGKELQDEFGLDWYDYGARFYDAPIGRFHTIDPLSEEYNFQSAFVYGANNPIRFIDWMGMGPGDPPAGTTQLYITLTGSFGPQIGYSYGDLISGTIRASNVEGTTKLGVSFSPEGKMSFLFEQESKNVDYQVEGEFLPFGGKSVSQEYVTDEHPSMAAEKTETQKGLVKETISENYEEKQTTESTTFEVGIGIRAIIIGLKVNIGFENIMRLKEEKTNEPIENENKVVPADEAINDHYRTGSLY